MVKRKSVRKRRGSNVRRRSSKRKISRRKKLNKYINKGGKRMTPIALLTIANEDLEMKLEREKEKCATEKKTLNEENKELNDENKDLLAKNKELNDKYEALKKMCNDEIKKSYDKIIKYENFLAKPGWQWHG